ncbi:acyltransferase [Granulicella sp. S190]|uniref:acyltransferase family protein n=1 Tax=Granulicella sp. S190 TaxID=1747226 RepID=UPI00210FC5D4|nr:acyltransferase [Granulicella sp. S190]
MTTLRQNELLKGFLKERYFPALDGIRAVSVLLVMSNHLHSNYAFLRRMPGWTGVDFFCVLSGFLITTLLLREEKDFGSVRLAPFYIRRFFRIVPIFLLVLLFYFPVAYFGEHGIRWAAFKSALPLYLTFMQDFVPHEAPFSFSWTLGIEEKFYFIWPILAFLLLKKLRGRALVAGAFFLVSASLYLIFESVSDRAYFHARSYAALALGALLACLLASNLAQTYTRWISRIPSFLPPLAVILALALVFYDRQFVMALDLSIALLLSHLLLIPSSVRAWFAAPVLVWIGRRSYSMYLIHLLVLTPVRVALHPKSVFAELAVLVIAYFITAGLSHLIYLFVEEPMRLFGKRVIAKRLSNSRQPVAILDTPN